MSDPVPARPKLVLIQLAGADWRYLHPLIDAGAMPNLDRMISQGVMGNLFSPKPLSQPTLSTTLATARKPDQHGVLHELTPDAGALGYRRVDASDWRAPALWDMVAARGQSVAVVNWPATHSSTKAAPLVVSDRFCDAQGPSFEDWPFDPACVSDASVGETLAELRMHPMDVSEDMLAVFAPEGAPIDFETDTRPAIFADCLARAVTAHSAATWIAEHATPDLLVVHFDFLATLKNQFVQYRAPRLGHVTDADFARFAHVVNSAYQFADMMLAPYLDLVGADGSVMVVSAHGFLDGAFRPRPVAKGNGAAAARHHRELGILVAKTPEAMPDTLSFGAHDVDIVPTVLAMLGLAAEPGLSGRAIEALAQPRPAQDTPTPVPARLATPTGNFRRLAQLVELDILARPDPDPEVARDKVGLAQLRVLLETLMAQRKFGEALSACEDILERAPGQVDAARQKLACLVETSQLDTARVWLSSLEDLGMASAELAYLEARMEFRAGHTDRVAELLSRAEAVSGSPVAQLRMLENIGLFHLERKDDDSAERVLRAALALDATSAPALSGLGRKFLHQRDYAQAIKYLRRSLAKFREQPFVHLRLGDAYFAQSDFTAAELSYATAQGMAPNLNAAKEGRARAALKRQETAST
ncbi:MAG: alkaline phosphatase family protein [Paracoccaceae bacterium]